MDMEYRFFLNQSTPILQRHLIGRQTDWAAVLKMLVKDIVVWSRYIDCLIERTDACNR